MNPIINPWWFYFINICEGIKICSIIFAIFAGIGAVVSAILWQYYEAETHSWGNDGSDRQAANAWFIGFKVALIIFLITLVLALLVPSATTVGYMLTATLATTDNINMIYDTIIRTATDLIALF